jgi:hypothetical protein
MPGAGPTVGLQDPDSVIHGSEASNSKFEFNFLSCDDNSHDCDATSGFCLKATHSTFTCGCNISFATSGGWPAG